MGKSNHDRIYEEAILYYPFLTRNLVEWHPYKNDEFSIVFSYKDGSKMFYDSILKGVRYFSPQNILDVYTDDESRWRKEVGFNIHRAMLKYGVDQKELSVRSGISQGTISKYTDGIMTPSSYKLNKIAKTLGCNIEELIFIRSVDNI